MLITKDKNNLIIKVPLKQDATDAIGQKCGTIDNIIGIACNDEYGNEELGFSRLSDRTYKGASPDICEIFFYVNDLEKEAFEKLCEELEIDFFEYPICAYCHKTIYGSFTEGDKGNMCSDCEDKGE